MDVVPAFLPQGLARSGVALPPLPDRAAPSPRLVPGEGASDAVPARPGAVDAQPKPQPQPEREEPAAARRRHGALVALLALGVICVFDASIVTALLTPIKADLALNDEAFGRIAAAFTLAGIVGAPLFGYLAGRFGRKPVLIGGIVLWSLASAGGALAAGVAGLLIWRALTGFGEAAYQGLAPSWIADLYDRRWRNFVFSLYMIRNKLGTALALAVGSWIAGLYDWRAAFLLSGIPGLLLALVFLFVREPRPGAADGAPAAAAPRPGWRAPFGLLRIPAYAGHLAALAFFFTGTATAQMWTPAFLHRVYGLTNPEAAGFLATVLLATTPVGLIGGFLAGRILTRYRAGLALALAGTSAIAAAAFALAFLSRDLATTKAAIIVAITAFGSTAGSLTTLMVETVPPHLRPAAGSLGAVVSAGFAGIVGPWLLGFLSDVYGLDRAIFLGAAAYALAALVWLGSALARPSAPAASRFSSATHTSATHKEPTA